MRIGFRSRGRAHLEKLLNKAETVVRLSEADVLVLTGVQTGTHPSAFDPLIELLRGQGVTVRGVVLLAPGEAVTSLDLQELVRLDKLAQEAPVGTSSGAATSGPATAMVRCPRGCGEVIPVDVIASVIDDGQNLVTNASADQAEMAQHGFVCPGRSARDV